MRSTSDHSPIRALAVFAAVLLGCHNAAAQGRAGKPYARMLDQAPRALAAGDVESARELYEQALTLAENDAQRSAAAVPLADLIVRHSPTASGDPVALDRAEGLYRVATTAEDRTLRWRALNNLAALRIRRDKPAEAIALLAGLESEIAAQQQPSATAAAHCMYTLGRARSAAGDALRAFDNFELALKLDPSFNSAVDAALESATALADPAKAVAATAELARLCLARRDPLRCSDAVHAVLRRRDVPAKDGADPLLVVLTEWFATTKLTPARFASEWSRELRELRERIPRGEGSLLAALLQVYEGEWKPDTSGKKLPEPFATLGPLSPLQFSKLAKVVGDGFAERGDLPRALQRYALAFELDRRNAGAALYLANTLLTARKELDPEGVLLARLVEPLMEIKGESYAAQDDANIKRYHVVLAQIFEQEGKWGPKHEVRTAAFQWDGARRAHERLVERGLTRDKLEPAILAGLGRSYEHLGEKRAAYDAFIGAAEGYAAFERKDALNDVLQSALSLGLGLGDNETERVMLMQQRFKGSGLLSPDDHR